MSEEGLGEFGAIKDEVLNRLNPPTEPEFSIPTEIDITQDGEKVTEIEVSPEDFADFVKRRGVELTPEQLQNLNDNGVLPSDIFSENDLEDFEDYIKEAKADEIEELLENAEYDPWYQRMLGNFR